MPFSQGHALLIGVGTHAHATDLDEPVTYRDAQYLRQTLIDPNTCGYPKEQVKLLTNESATTDQITTQLNSLVKTTKPEDTVLIFYSGHGVRDQDGGFALATHDVIMDGNRAIPDTGLSARQLLLYLNRIQAKRLLLIFNACHSGMLGTGRLGSKEKESKGINPSKSTAYALLGSGEGRVLIVSCRKNESSYFIRGQERTIFAEALIEGLSGEARNNSGYIGAFDLYTYIYDEVKEKAATIDEQQEPMLTVIRGVGPFPVALWHGAQPGEFAENVGQLSANSGQVESISADKATKSFQNLSGVNTGDQSAGGDIINAGEGAAVAKGHGAQAASGRGVVVGGSIRGNVITGDGNHLTVHQQNKPTTEDEGAM